MDFAATRDLAVKQIEFARQYTQSLLAEVEDADWFRVPPGATTHIAWQVGHLAMAEYGLCLYRQRGRESSDLELMPSKFRKQFSRGSLPELTFETHPSPSEIRVVWERVHERALLELPTFSAEQLAEPIDMPYMATPTKLGALLFCSHHEMIHAGQIGLIRRLLGKQPVR